jgi:hypothetical protein
MQAVRTQCPTRPLPLVVVVVMAVVLLVPLHLLVLAPQLNQDHRGVVAEDLEVPMQRIVPNLARHRIRPRLAEALHQTHLRLAEVPHRTRHPLVVARRRIHHPLAGVLHPIHHPSAEALHPIHHPSVEVLHPTRHPLELHRITTTIAHSVEVVVEVVVACLDLLHLEILPARHLRHLAAPRPLEVATSSRAVDSEVATSRAALGVTTNAAVLGATITTTTTTTTTEKVAAAAAAERLPASSLPRAAANSGTIANFRTTPVAEEEVAEDSDLGTLVLGRIAQIIRRHSESIDANRKRIASSAAGLMQRQQLSIIKTTFEKSTETSK